MMWNKARTGPITGTSISGSFIPRSMLDESCSPRPWNLNVIRNACQPIMLKTRKSM